jgi:hypothetical protein
MSLINASLLFGMGLATLPVILHLIMRSKPKRIEFPALRLLKSRKVSNSRRMQLRHLLLLILRSLIIVMLVLAIARPSLPAARYGLRWWEWLILALTAAASVATYFWFTRRTALKQAASVDQRERRGKMRLWCVVLGALAAIIAVGIPWGLRVRAELASPRNEATEDVPIAAVFLIDTSVSMNYRQENKTRLEQAREVVREHIGRFPAGSRAAIAGLSIDDDVVFQADLSGAAARLDTLETTTVPDSINRRLKSAIQFQTDDRAQEQERLGTGSDSDNHAREIYVLTDFSKTAWRDPDESGLSDALKAASWLQVYLVDVAVQQPINTSISHLTLSEETSVAGRDLLLTMTVSSTTGAPTVATVETVLLENGIETPTGAPQIVKIENGSKQVQTTLRISGTKPFVDGIVRLTSPDPLPEDNVRSFACGVRAKPNVLLIADRLEESLYLRNAMQPTQLEQQGIKFCECTSVTTAQAEQQTLSNYDVVMLINCQRPEERLWDNLRNFASAGGGVFVVAGSDKIQAGAWTRSSAKNLLPGTPLRTVNFNTEPGNFKLIAEQHPLTREFAQDEAARVELSRAAFDRCWALDVDPTATTLLGFTGPGDRPALMERTIGQGRCLMFTSALDNLRDGGSKWNNFVADNWSFLMLTDKILQYLTGASSTKRNYIAGETIVIPVPASQRFDQYLLRRPGLRQTPGEMRAEESSVLITDATDVGHYRLKPFEARSPFEAAFAVNMRDDESNLEKIRDDQLNGLLAGGNVAIVHEAQELQRAVRMGRLGVEVFPVLMGLVILIFCAEHLMANFFYDEEATAAV